MQCEKIQDKYSDKIRFASPCTLMWSWSLIFRKNLVTSDEFLIPWCWLGNRGYVGRCNGRNAFSLTHRAAVALFDASGFKATSSGKLWSIFLATRWRVKNCCSIAGCTVVAQFNFCSFKMTFFIKFQTFFKFFHSGHWRNFLRDPLPLKKANFVIQVGKV